ncbi:type IVB secretion system protein IcmH/DotU (plasmid) [Thioclava litoralis]|uniref:Type IVB secretion system protein IcmH/DotU n=1 Tax=Thioclava litoralis TaxID=3076557 RepID=A0ABZ1E3Z1_9RHOB|nr:type IVB secretion system protein IcmH/DotU [Thioclava sp. FTW29]
MSDDDDKTVFGQPLPSFPPRKDAGRPAAPQPPAREDDTWLGGALKPQQGYPAASPQQPPYPAPQPPQGWGHPVPPQPPQHVPQGGYPGQNPPDPNPYLPPQQPAATPYGQPLYQPDTGARPEGAGMFPDLNQPQAQAARVAPRIALADALRASARQSGEGAASNPLLAEATGLLILLGRLRTGLVEMQSGPLLDHVARAIDDFETRALARGLPAPQVRDAKYALSATADDIVQNLPGADRGMWLQYSMVARFFGERSSGVGFFQKVDEAMKVPGQSFNLLELMLSCLQLGFEGQYRTLPNGSVELARIRSAIYETLRRVSPRPDDDVSPAWEGVPMHGRRQRGATPVWVVGLIAGAMLVALFATLSTLLTRQSATVRDQVLALHRGIPDVTIERTEPVVTPYQASSTQMQRISDALQSEIDAGRVEVTQSTDWVLVRVGDALRFATGRETLADTQSVMPLLGAIAQTLDKENGPIRVVGHTDSVPMSGRGRFKTNQALSEARAQTVAGVLEGLVKDPARISAEGKGATDPVADNKTAEGRARNRRVEIMIPRED